MVTPKTKMPNERSGVILGQSSFIDKMVIETTPRSILVKRGEEVKEDFWGEIKVKSMLDEDEILRDYN